MHLALHPGPPQLLKGLSLCSGATDPSLAEVAGLPAFVLNPASEDPGPAALPADRHLEPANAAAVVGQPKPLEV